MVLLNHFIYEQFIFQYSSDEMRSPSYNSQYIFFFLSFEIMTHLFQDVKDKEKAKVPEIEVVSFISVSFWAVICEDWSRAALYYQKWRIEWLEWSE